MHNSNYASRSRRGANVRLLLGPVLALCVLGAGVTGAAPVAGQHAARPTPPEAARYNIIPLSDDRLASDADINSRGEVAFTESTEIFDLPAPGVIRARFYDGKTVRSLGTFGGLDTRAFAVNDLGQVTGVAQATNFDEHAFRWSRERGLIDLTAPGMGSSAGLDINNRGDVAGGATYASQADALHATRWSVRNGARDLNPVTGLRSLARAVNDAGTVAGWSDSAAGIRPFRWTRAGGLQLLGTFGGEAADINAAGHIVGTASFRQDGPPHAFLWTPRGAMIDLGRGGGQSSGATGINDRGTVIGFVDKLPAYFRGFVWTHRAGLVEIGTGNASSFAADLNNRDQVVGNIGGRAFAWTPSGGAVDLNTRVRNAPQGLVLRDAQAISDNGSIVALTNTGMVLLTTQAVSRLRPLAGPIIVTGTPRIGMPLSFMVNFTDADPRDTHTAVWDWGEGDPATETGVVIESNGRGSVTAQRAFPEGEFTIRLTITDSSGKRTVVRHDLMVPSDDGVAGQGTFMSPPGAVPLGTAKPGIAAFASHPPGPPRAPASGPRASPRSGSTRRACAFAAIGSTFRICAARRRATRAAVPSTAGPATDSR